jgi:hypothetical protein
MATRKPRTNTATGASQRFVLQEEDMVPAQCNSCRHLLATGTCAAFPDAIPIEILVNRVDHRIAYTGPNGRSADNGIRWAPISLTVVHPLDTS